MTDKDMALAASGTGLSQAEPVPVSSVPASIPSAAALSNGPELWAAILGQMPKGAIIAGGAVRDYLLGFEPKDIDVFMAAPVVAELADDLDLPIEFASYDPRHGLMRIEADHQRFEEYAAVSNIVCVSSGTLFGYRVDAVDLDDFEGGERLADQFDFGITRCWFDGHAIHDTPEAKRDRDSRSVTLILQDRIERSVARFERLRARWGDEWQLVRPASGTEARSGETEGLDPQDDGPVRDSADAEPSSGPSK